MLYSTMRINHKKLIGLPVLTKSGQAVGKLAEVEVETDNGRIETLVVHTAGPIPAITHNELLIAWSQVVLISEKEIIVADATVPVSAASIAMGVVPPISGMES